MDNSDQSNMSEASSATPALPEDGDRPRGRHLSRRQLLGLSGLGLLALGGASFGIYEWVQPGPPPPPYRSAPQLSPPEVTLLVPAQGTARGLIFMAPGNPALQTGPMIVDNLGTLVWFKPLPSDTVATNVQVQYYRGRPVLTWWEGQVILPGGYGRGDYVIADTSYREIARVHGGNGLVGDLHEFIITPQQTAMFTAYKEVPADLSSVGGPVKGTLLDSYFQEVDIASGRVLFQWNARDHVALNESYLPATDEATTGFYDYFHINSIQVDFDGNLLISARHTWTVYKLDRRTGDIIWRLNGKLSDFSMGPDAQFAFQHHARRRRDGTLTVFDDGGGPPNVDARSRGLLLKLDMAAMRATMEQQFLPDPAFLATSQGSVQLLENGNYFVGWGAEPYWSEYAPDGRMLFDAQLPAGESSYRAFRFRWTGLPGGRPATALETAADGQLRLYMSWNGATEIARWDVLGGRSPATMRRLTTVGRTGFETVATVHSHPAYVAALARDRHGKALGRSETLTV